MWNKEEIRGFIVFVRLDLYNNGLKCGGKAIQKRMREMEIIPLPSVSKINRVLDEEWLTYKRTGYYPEEFGLR